MANTPQVTKRSALSLDGDGNYVLPPDHRMPGWKVDALLEQGKVQEAREELGRLLDEGDDSDPGVEATPQFYDDLLAEVKRRSEARR